MEHIQCSETSANNNQTPGKYPKNTHKNLSTCLEPETEPRICVVTASHKNFLIAAKFLLAVRQGKESNIPL